MSERTMIYVKMKDPRSIFRDAGAGITLQGEGVFKVPASRMVTRALAGGALVRVPDDEGKKLEAESAKKKAAAKKQPEAAPKEEAVEETAAEPKEEAKEEAAEEAAEEEAQEESAEDEQTSEEEGSEDADLEALKAAFAEKFGKQVPNNKAKDAEWIQSKLDS